jgi:hypothetical protein
MDNAKQNVMSTWVSAWRRAFRTKHVASIDAQGMNGGSQKLPRINDIVARAGREPATSD